MAIFVVRYHNGPNIGRIRFDIIKELANDALDTFLKGLNYGHILKGRDKQLFKALTKTADEVQKGKKGFTTKKKETQDEDKEDSQNETGSN